MKNQWLALPDQVVEAGLWGWNLSRMGKYLLRVRKNALVVGRGRIPNSPPITVDLLLHQPVYTSGQGAWTQILLRHNLTDRPKLFIELLTEIVFLQCFMVSLYILIHVYNLLYLSKWKKIIPHQSCHYTQLSLIVSCNALQRICLLKTMKFNEMSNGHGLIIYIYEVRWWCAKIACHWEGVEPSFTK